MKKEKQREKENIKLEDGDICIFDNEGKYSFTPNIKEAIKNAIKEKQ